MTSRNLTRRVNAFVLAVLLVLAAVPANAFPLTGELSLGSLWETFRSLVIGVWQGEGIMIDPNGATAPGDEGMTIDPNGVTAVGEEGMSIDPNG